MISRLCAGVIGLFFLMAPFAQAGVLYLVKGETVPLKLEEVPTQISISNPAVLDVTVDETDVLLTGKESGRTDLVIVGSDGQERKYEVVVWEEDVELQYKKLKRILSALGLDKKVSLKLDKESGLLLLSGTVFSHEEMNRVEQAVSALGSQVLVNLVHEASVKDSIRLSLNVLEVGTDLNKGFGISWPQELRLTAIGQDVEDESGNGLPFSRGAIRFNIWERNDLSILIRALETNHKGKVLARPNIMAANGKPAKIVVGGEIPIVTYEDNTASVEYKPYGVILDMTPTIIREGLDLKIKCEVSDIDPVHSTTVNIATDTTNAVYSVPAFVSRQAETEITLKDGQTVVIGGLLQRKKGENRSALFGLSKLPIIGEFFRSKDITSSETELVITITPEILGLVSQGDVGEVSEYKAGKAAGSSQDGEDGPAIKDIEDYAKYVLRKVREELRRYPLVDAKGKVVVSLKVREDGSVENVVIKESPGDKRLERIALNIARDIQPLPPLPEGTDLDVVWLDLPFVFQ